MNRLNGIDHNLKKLKMNLQQINQLNFEDVLLQKLGIEPKVRNRNSLFYISPLRPNEKTASFHITKFNPYDLYFDHGSGNGGKIVDFFIKFLNTTPKGVVEYFNDNSFSFQKQSIERVSDNISLDKNYVITKIKKIESLPLIQYLEFRKIPIELAQNYCKEIHYTINNRNYFAIGFPTEKGFEIRNKYIKSCLNGKGLTWILNDKNSVKLFESWSDFLSYLVLYREQEFKSDFLILNSVSLLRKRVEFLYKYEKVQSFFDTDIAGKSLSRFLSEYLGSRYTNSAGFYNDFKDVNDFLVETKISKRKTGY
mgnify:FL=1